MDNLKQSLSLMGYFDFKEVESKGLCAVIKLMFGYGLVIDLTEDGFYGVYRYISLQHAQKALDEWDGKGHPKGSWTTYEDTDGNIVNVNYYGKNN